MAKFIEKNCALGAKVAVELGAGCGFTACHLAKTQPDCKVIATDMDTVLPLIERNVARNSMQDRVRAMPLFWGN